MSALPPACVRIFLLVAYGIFIAVGIATISTGIYFLVQKSKVEDIGEEVKKSASKTRITSILAGILDLSIGVVGLVGTLLKKRIMLMVNAGMLSAAVLGNFVMIILTVVAYSSESSERFSIMQDRITNHYGNNTITESKQITIDIDSHQTTEACCGWSGRGGENLFLKSQWYREINRDNSKTGKKRTLPDSCCSKHEEKCFSATDVQEARKAGFVHELDCFEQMDIKGKAITLYMVIQLTVVSLLQAVCAMVTVMMILEQTE